MSAGRTPQTWRVIDLLNWGTTYFAEHGFAQPRREIEWLLGDFLDCRRLDLYLRFEEPLTRPQLQRFRGWVKRRVQHEPPQYISGRAEFYGLTFAVTPAVLIPRPETERLVAVALETLAGREAPRIYEVGTGSGCIAVALGRELPAARIVATDVSAEALALARRNAADHGVENIVFEQTDFLGTAPVGPFDLVVSNPPYVPAAEMAGLMPEVRDFEPAAALSDGADGLTFYRRFRELAPRIVAPGGWLVLETGRGEHPRQAAELFAGLPAVELVKDFNGDDRVLKIRVG